MQNFELASTQSSESKLAIQATEDTQLGLLSLMNSSGKQPAPEDAGDHTTSQTPGEPDKAFDNQVAESLSARMAERTFQELPDLEDRRQELNFSDVQRMHRLVSPKMDAAPDDYIKVSSDLICTEQLSPGAPESGSMHLTQDQFQRFLRDQILNLQPSADGPARSEPIPIYFTMEGQRKEIGVTLQLSEDSTGDVTLP